MSGRPMGPKKLAAIKERDALRAQNIPDDEIRQILIQSGLTKAQAIEIVPIPLADQKPLPAKAVLDDEMKAANINGAIHFLETIAKRLTPNVCDRFTELGPLKGDALTWARKLKGIL